MSKHLFIRCKPYATILALFLCVVSFPIFSNASDHSTVENSRLQQRLLDIDKHVDGQALGTYLSYYTDREQTKNISQIKQLNASDWHQSNDEIPSFGYQDFALWFELNVVNRSDTDENYVINIANSNLDDIQIFIFLNDQLQDEIRLGDRYPFHQRMITDRNFLIPIELKSHTQYQIYLRVDNLGTLQVPLYFQTPNDVIVEQQTTLLLWGIYFGLTLIMVLYNFILFVSVREQTYLLFSLFILANVLFHACLHGFGFQYLWPELEGLNRWLMPSSNAFLYICGGLFISQFVDLKSISQLQYKFMMSIILFSALMTIASPFLPYQISVVTNTMTGFPFAIASIIASITALKQGNQAVRFFLLSWVVFIIAAFVLTANKMGIIPRNALTENGLQIGNALSILLISVALADSINIEKKQRMAADEETLRLEKEARKNKEAQYEMALQTKEAELKTQSEIISAREEVLLAKAQSKTKSQFLATMSHEIRTPLNGILGMSDMLKDTSLTNKQQDILSVITNSGRSLLNLINDILDFSKVEAGKMKMEYRIFNYHQLHQDVIKNFHLLAKEKGIQLICEIEEAVPHYIKSDSNRIQQVLLNLLGNALKFTENGSVKLLVTCEESANQTNLLLKTQVIDSGIGLTSKQKERLFQAFSQADGSTTRKYGGTGLGLSISKKIIELLGGKIDVISKKDEGANFWFEIPSERLTKEALKGIEKRQDKKFNLEKEEEIKNKLSGLNILVAEDNKVNQMVIKGLLSKLGLSCSIVENGKDAFDYVANDRNGIDAILMDCEMPVMDGYDATEAIRKWELKNDKQATPIIAVTAHALDEMVESSYSAGMNAHIAKPVDLQILSKTLMEVLCR